MTESIALGSQAVLLNFIPEATLLEMREANKDNAEVVALIDARVQNNANALALEQELEAFTSLLGEVALPFPPDGIYNLYVPFRKDSRPLHKKEREEYLSTHSEATTQELDAKRIELETSSWGAWQINKPTSSSVASSSTKAPSTRKLAITVNKREENSLVVVGNFRTSKEACIHFSLDTHKDSAKRVLEAHKYIVDSYDGTDFLVSES